MILDDCTKAAHYLAGYIQGCDQNYPSHDEMFVFLKERFPILNRYYELIIEEAFSIRKRRENEQH